MNQAAPAPATQPTPWLSIAQFTVSGLALVSMCGLGLLIGLLAFLSEANGGVSTPVEATTLTMQAAGLFFSGLLFLPGLYLSLLTLLNRPQPASLFGRLGRWLPWAAGLAWPLVLLAGRWVMDSGTLNTLLLPPIYVLAVSIPVWVLLEAARRGLPGGPPQRFWGLFNLGMLAGPMLILGVELLVFGLLLVGFIVWAAGQPDVLNELNTLFQRILLSSGSPETLGRLMRPYLLRPTVLFTMLGLISGIVPLIEEALKPVGMWLLARRRLTPAEGFVAGLLSGAGFALFESLGIASNQPGENWAAVTFARAGTDLVHIAATGLLGWALASAWREGRYLRLAGIYLASTLLHGLWNMIALGLGITPLIQMDPANLPNWLGRTTLAPLALGLLFIILLALVLTANLRLRRKPAIKEPEWTSLPS